MRGDNVKLIYPRQVFPQAFAWLRRVTVQGIPLRKEVIQPQVLLRLPCYDLVPVTDLAVGTAEPRRLRALPAPMT